MNSVVQIVQHLSPGGIETMALDLHGYFDRQGERSYIVSLEGDRQSAIKAWPRLRDYADRVLFLDKPAGVSPAFVTRLARQLRALDAQTLHTHHIGPLLYGGLASHFTSIRTHIHTEHDAWHLECPRRRRLQRWLLRLSKPVLVADAQAVGDAIRRLLNPRELTVIPNGVDTRKFSPGPRGTARRQLGLPAGAKIIGCAGRLEAIKGQGQLIEALIWLPPEVHVALAGGGSYEAELRAQASALGLDDRVHFLGRLDDVATFYRALDCFCLPSFKEGMPLSPLEAQACDIPAIVTDVGAARESLCPESGVLIAPGDSGAIADAATRLLNRGPGVSPRAFVRREADFDTMAQAYTALHATQN